MLDAFNNDLDIHSDTASKVFGVPINEMTSDLRRKAKAINLELYMVFLHTVLQNN